MVAHNSVRKQGMIHWSILLPAVPALRPIRYMDTAPCALFFLKRSMIWFTTGEYLISKRQILPGNLQRAGLIICLAVEPMQNFLQVYFYEKRYVQSQKINLTPAETAKLVALINENLKPENVRYRYDFFYDDCSTRIRDLIEKAVGDKLLYPPATGGKSPTFREMVGKYQEPFPWLKFGIDLLLGFTIR